ncbi:hypothetical protein WHI96_07570 [Pseudonocardia tropica]|uniref:Haloacid dehalogenase-like hydrolase n=1 Tax=Pseudonocardia tropica TaxID=681289 RepID=A0ABV1JRW2_9PSEU
MTGTVPDGAPVVFDLDGTLVRSEHVHRRARARFFAEWGTEVDDGTYRHRFVGRRAADALCEVDGPWRDTDPDELVARPAGHGIALADDVVPGAPALLRSPGMRSRPRPGAHRTVPDPTPGRLPGPAA